MPSITILTTPHIYELTAPVADSKRPVLVFVHGWLLSRRYWQPLVDLLQSEYQCLIYDARGFGESHSQLAHLSKPSQIKTSHDASLRKSEETPLFHGEVSLTEDELLNSKSYSLKAYAEDLGCLLASLSIEYAWVIGHSLGGSVALWAAELYPQVVQGVVCLNAGGGIYLKEEFERFRNAGQQLVKFRPRWLSYVPLLNLVFSRMMVARPLALKWGRQRVLDFIQADEQAAMGALLESTTETEVHLLPQLVSRLQQPVYFIAGDRDRVMEIKYVKHLASFHSLFASQDSNVFQIDNCGHLGMIEAPNEVASIVQQILSKHAHEVSKIE
ncbi:MAG: alpha/beta hydrolase [Pleurocapsa sp. SU_5_0]|nr:alpha/beta hydrolase [Pleurocapsa sp. SU_5_0]NJO97679.1 alpha/beta hydrolase [Pleurocapsa sp. CRU_1_2]NJR46913.1 alpha/beta hydrolase [Hyellaceae cyanobacterium CSU_1_1]